MTQNIQCQSSDYLLSIACMRVYNSPPTLLGPRMIKNKGVKNSILKDMHARRCLPLVDKDKTRYTVVIQTQKRPSVSFQNIYLVMKWT